MNNTKSTAQSSLLTPPRILLLTTVLLVALPGLVIAQPPSPETTVSGGDVSGTWTRDGSPYLIVGDVTVPAGETLAIEPGVEIYTEAGYGITVLGDLQSIGSSDEPILFTGPSDGFPEHYGWRGIRIQGGSEVSRLEHTIVEYGDLTSTYESGSGVSCLDTTCEIRHSTLRRNTAYYNGAGLHCLGGEILIHDSEVTDNHILGANNGQGAGIYGEECEVTISENRIHHNTIQVFTSGYGANRAQGGGIALRESNALVVGNSIWRNYLSHSGTGGQSAGGGIYVYLNDFNYSQTLRGNTVWANRLNYTNRFGAGIFVRAHDVDLIDNIVADNLDGAGMYLSLGSASQLEHNSLYGNEEGAFDGPYVPDGAGVVNTTNSNGTPSDEFYNIYLDPKLSAPNAGDFTLQPDSPCIDAGDPASPMDPDGSIADIGAPASLESAMIFADGFEEGTMDRWSSVVN